MLRQEGRDFCCIHSFILALLEREKFVFYVTILRKLDLYIYKLIEFEMNFEHSLAADLWQEGRNLSVLGCSHLWNVARGLIPSSWSGLVMEGISPVASSDSKTCLWHVHQITAHVCDFILASRVVGSPPSWLKSKPRRKRRKPQKPVSFYLSKLRIRK